MLATESSEQDKERENPFYITTTVMLSEPFIGPRAFFVAQMAFGTFANDKISAWHLNVWYSPIYEFYAPQTRLP